MDATNTAQQQQQNQPRPKLMYIQIPQERVGSAGGGHVKLSPHALPPPGGTSGLRTAAPHTLGLPGGPLGLRTTAPLTLSSPGSASCLRTSAPHTLALRPMPQGSSTLQKPVMKPIPRLTNASFIRVSSPAPIVTGQVVRVATALTGKSLETKPDASKLCKVSLTPTVATHRITIPGCSRSPQAITITGHNISPKISSPLSSTASRGPESPTINRRILPAPSPSGPIIRVTAPNRLSPSTLTIHPGGKGSMKQLSSPLANTIQNAAVILSNSNATSPGFPQPGLLSSTGVILSHGKVTALAAPQSIPLQGTAAGVPQGIILGSASVPVSVSSIRLWPASSRPLDAVATLVDLTLDKETDDSTGLVSAKPEGLLSEVLMASGAGGIPVVTPRAGQLNNTGLPSTPVILHTPKLPVSSLSAGYGLSMGGVGSSVNTRPIITVPRLRFTTHPTLASLAKKNSPRETFPSTSTHAIPSDTPSVSTSIKLPFTHSSVAPTARSTPSHTSTVGFASTIPHSSGSTSDTLAPVISNTNYTTSFSTTPSPAAVIPSLVPNSLAASSSSATVCLSPARSKAFALNATTDAQSIFPSCRSDTLTPRNLFPGASPGNVLTSNVMSCNASNTSALFIASQSCITSPAVTSNPLQLSNNASATTGSSNTCTTSLPAAIPIASVTSSIPHPPSSLSLSTTSAVTASYKNRSPATDLSRTAHSSCESAVPRDTSSSSDRTHSQLPAYGTDNCINESSLLECQSRASSSVGCSGVSHTISTSSCNQAPCTESSSSDSRTTADDNITLNIIRKDGKITLQSNIGNDSRDASSSSKFSADRLKTDKFKPVMADADILERTTRTALEDVSSEAVNNLKPLAQMQRKTGFSINEGSGDTVSGACEISQTNHRSEEKLNEFPNKADIDNESQSSSAGLSLKADDADDDISFILCTKSGSSACRPSSVGTSALKVESKPCDEEDNLRCDEELPDALSNADDDSPRKLEDLRFGELLSLERRDRVIELQGTRLKLKLNEFNALEIDGQVTMEQLKMLSPTSEKGFNLNDVLMHLEKDLAGESVDVLSRFSKEVMNNDSLYTPGTILEQGSNEYRTEILQRCEEQVNKLFKAANASLKEKGEAPAIVTISEEEEDDEVVDCKKGLQSNAERPEDERGVVSSTSGSAAECLDEVTIIGETGRDTGLAAHLPHPDRDRETAPPGQGACAVPVDSSVAGGSDVKPLPSPAEGDDENESRVCVCAVCGSYGLESEFMRGGQYCSPSCCRQAHDQQDSDDTGFKGSKSRKNPDDSCSGKENLFNAQAAETEKEDKDVTYLKEVFNSRSPRPDQRVPFSWVKYLELCLQVSEHGKAAPLKLWPEPFPCSKNLFQPGMKLEGVDPQHQSLFCVLTVVDVMGHRVKLHFDGYSDVHDFWTNADSPLLFCVGWCERNGRVLSPPPGTARFSWKGYLEHCRAAAAPRQAFATRHVSVVVQTNNIRAGMKLEAEDRKNGWMCVATVKDVMENRLLVHFDGWDSAFDFWTEVNSPYIHPVGWCSENTVQLYAPKDYPNPESFNWHEYLQETNSVAAPTRSFRTRSPREFKKDMKLEVVDRRNPMLVRVATVVDVHYYQIKVHFDGWDEMYDYWIDDDSPDAHPPSWCSKTGHPLQPPLTSDPSPDAVTSGCGVLGCKGYGHIKGPIYTTHHTAYGCPYSPQNLCKDPDLLIPDRIVCEPERKTRKFSSKAVLLDLGTGNMEDDDNLKKRVRKRRRFFDEISTPESKAKLPKLANGDESGKLFSDSAGGDPLLAIDHRDSESVLHREGCHPSRSGGREEQLSLDAQVHQSVFSSNCLAVARGAPLHNWRHLKHLFEPLQDIDKDKILEWTPEEVEDALLQLSGCSDMLRVFARERIDGAALLLLTQADLVTLLQIKLGHALKVMAFIDSVRKRLPRLDKSEKAY